MLVYSTAVAFLRLVIVFKLVFICTDYHVNKYEK